MPILYIRRPRKHVQVQPLNEQVLPCSAVGTLEATAVNLLASRINTREIAEFPFLEMLAGKAEERFRDEQGRKINKRWNLRHINAIEPRQRRMCTLCHGVIDDAYLECGNHVARKAVEENTWLRGIGIHGRVGGHLTCLKCLKQRQHMEIADVIAGDAKVCEVCESRDVLWPSFSSLLLPVSSFQRVDALLSSKCSAAGRRSKQNDSLSTLFPTVNTDRLLSLSPGFDGRCCEGGPGLPLGC